VYLSVPGGLAGLPLFRTVPHTFIFMFLWTVLSVEFIYTWRVIFNSLFILASQSQTLFFIGVSFHFLNNTSLKTSPRCHYTVVDLSWTPLLLSVIVRSVDILLWVSEFHTSSVLCPWGVFFRALAVVMLCRRYWFTWLSLFCQHWGEVKPCLQLQFHVLTLQYFSALPQNFVIKSFFFLLWMKVSGLIKLKASSATNTTLLSSFSAEGTTDFVMRDCVNKLKYCKCENGGAIC
jgi:hypothetical protein